MPRPRTTILMSSQYHPIIHRNMPPLNNGKHDSPRSRRAPKHCGRSSDSKLPLIFTAFFVLFASTWMYGSVVYMRNNGQQHLTILPNQERPSELLDKKEHPSAQFSDNKIQNIQAKAVHPPLTLIIPAHEASPFIEGLMTTLRNQTYTNLRLVFSLEPDADADITEAAIRQHFREDKHRHFQSLCIHRQAERLYYQENMIFLLSRVDTDLFSYMPCDDLLSSNYYEELVQCLELNKHATNCYPATVTWVDKKTSKIKSNDYIMRSSVGPVHERVEKVASENSWIPTRGVVRRLAQPSGFGTGFSFPRLHQSFTMMDHVWVLKHAIAGELIGCQQVSYFKILRDESVSSQHLKNRKVFNSEDLMIAIADSYAQKYNLAYSYVRNPRQLAGKMAKNANKKQRIMLKNNLLSKECDDEFFKRIRQHRRVAVLGAGIQGTLVALMFKKHGYDVTIIDRASDIMARTSASTQGRIHMGLEYANDPSMDTATYMLESAMRFAQYTEYLVNEKLDWSQLKSERLICLLARESHVTPYQFEEYGKKLGELYERVLYEHPELTYLGERPPKVLLGSIETPKAVNSSYIAAAYQSIEVCILVKRLKEIIRRALQEQGVTLVFNRTILGVKRNDEENGKKYGKLRVISDLGEHDYDVVVNCLWENRAKIDRQMGLEHNEKEESYRVRSNVRLPNLLELHGNIPSVAIMNGPFGDFTRYGNDDRVFFSWHPLNPKVMTHNVTEIETLFQHHVISDHPPDYKRYIIEGSRRAFEQIFPGIDSSFFDDAIVGTGYIVANGVTNIDDPKSGLHKRKDLPNLVTDGYISVKTQKLTSAPYNTYLLERELFLRNILD